jgi:superfamily I DNA and/or RNA helicase
VSALSYEGKLRSHASDRALAGVTPGLHPVPVRHRDNSTSSIEEADVVVGLVRDALGRPWTSNGRTVPLGESDVIVVAPYNAQVGLIRERLRAAGLAAVPVGTVDKFQGREAAVAIVSLAASSAEEVPRGLEFLLLANRLNVAISRAQWAAWLVYSPPPHGRSPAQRRCAHPAQRFHHARRPRGLTPVPSGGPSALPGDAETPLSCAPCPFVVDRKGH